jgi:DNA-binding response OmpR family regulator
MANATKPAVLITDDDAGIRGLLTTLTLQTGCTVDTATNGVEAMEKLRTRSYDLLLLDLMMPIMSGYDVVEAMKNMQQRPAVIVVTAVHDDDATTTLDGHVVSSILRKPFDVGAASDFIRVTATAMCNERAA